MRALIALADAGSYPAASAATGLSQPTLHRAVGDLSANLRRVLVERRGRGIALTEAGRRAVRAFKLARTELAMGVSEVAALQGQEAGQIKVGAMPLSRARLLPTAIKIFHQAHPHVKIRIIEGSYAELIEPLRDGDIDLLLGALRNPPFGEDLLQCPLFDDRPVVVARAGHPLARISDVTPACLAAFPWTISAPGTPLRRLWEQMFARTSVPPPCVPVECGSVVTIRQMLLDSDFLTLLSPDQVAVELAAGWLTQIAGSPEDMRRTIGITTRREWRPTRMQHTFLETLQMSLSKT
jgi:DNA-binding transcriptional LysR family regulator